jgi:quercetin dioxygenase-like cupin family protein
MKVKMLVLAALVGLVAAAPSLGAAPPIKGTPLGIGTMATPLTIEATTGAMIVERIRVAPGGNFGWHTHGSAVAVVVTAGTLTVYDPLVSSCAPFKVGKGQAFIEPANHIHLARNDGTKAVTLYATYLGVPKTSKPNVPGTQPSGCKA